MTTNNKCLFVFFIAKDEAQVSEIKAKEFSSVQFEQGFSKADPKGNARKVQAKLEAKFAILEQFGHYYDSGNERLVFFGVVDAKQLVSVNKGQANLVGGDTLDQENSAASKFVKAIRDSIGLKRARCTWVVVPLDELESGLGTLFVEGMAGVSDEG